MTDLDEVELDIAIYNATPSISMPKAIVIRKAVVAYLAAATPPAPAQRILELEAHNAKLLHDYLRRHKEAVDRYEAIQEAIAILRTSGHKPGLAIDVLLAALRPSPPSDVVYKQEADG